MRCSRHPKGTGMKKNWRNLKIAIRKYPYRLDPDYSIGLSEAQEIIKRDGVMPFDKMIEAAMRRYPLTEEAWEPAQKAVNQAKRRLAVKRMFANGRERVVARKRLVTVSLCLLLLLSFFTLTPVGRTLAKEIANMFVRLFDNSIQFGTNERSLETPHAMTTPASLGDIQPQVELLSFNSIEEFVLASGREDVILLNLDLYDFVGIQANPNNARGYSLITEYKSKEGFAVVLLQTWLQVDEMAGVMYAEQGYTFTSYIMGTIPIYCMVDNEDGHFTGIAWINAIEVMIGAESGVDIEMLLESVEFSIQ